MKGTYLLLLKLDDNKKIKIGKKKTIDFTKGFYLYVGSALNSIEGRINRHIKKNKKNHWHIDYLLNHADIINIYFKESKDKQECFIVKKFTDSLSAIPNFGCSDCSCMSHLFYGAKKDILFFINKLEMKKYINEKT
jgi:Uri superfamily endonuclease